MSEEKERKLIAALDLKALQEAVNGINQAIGVLNSIQKGVAGEKDRIHEVEQLLLIIETRLIQVRETLKLISR